MSAFPLSDKYKDFMRHNARVEFLEGTTFAGKTTVGVVKFMLKVAKSPKKLHVMAGLDLGTIEKNIIEKENGLQDVFGDLIEYNSKGKGNINLPHIIYKTPKGDKIIYVLGYDNASRWKKILGGQYGCVYVDEINVADIDFIREIIIRCDYLMGTLNPDNPDLDVYREFINHARPVPPYEHDAPAELRRMLDAEPKEDWTWWYFSFDHNKTLTEAKKKQIVESLPKNTKIHKNKILGLRGRNHGLVFSTFDERKHVLTKAELIEMLEDNEETMTYFSSGLDTAYSSNSDDIIAMVFIAITEKGKLLILDEQVYNNKDGLQIAPSDVAQKYCEFLDRNCREWDVFLKDVFIDSADQGTITELKKYKRKYACIYNFIDSYKKVTIYDRIVLERGWYHENSVFILDNCKVNIKERNVYSWNEKKDNTPEDANDHTINACQYAWIPYRDKIGINHKITQKRKGKK